MWKLPQFGTIQLSSASIFFTRLLVDINAPYRLVIHIRRFTWQYLKSILTHEHKIIRWRIFTFLCRTEAMICLIQLPDWSDFLETIIHWTASSAWSAIACHVEHCITYVKNYMNDLEVPVVKMIMDSKAWQGVIYWIRIR